MAVEEIELLRESGTDTALGRNATSSLGMARYETAAILRRDDVTERFSVIDVYYQAFPTSRVMWNLRG
ncbi:hypothetical protein [Dietzia sp. 2505]|uniref:hypothetical protein n=1 Tax=Dietzia sp. 2505 TaxID=3156457 RepID=UPI0033920491